MKEAPIKYQAFISYSSKDSKPAKWLHRKLEGYKIPIDLQGQENRRGEILGKDIRPVFRDRDELPSSNNLGEKIEEALDNSQHLVVLCSTNSANSEWVNQEIEYFISIGKKTRF